MSGTDIRYAMGGYAAIDAMLLRNVRYRHALCCYAMRSTDMGYVPVSSILGSRPARVPSYLVSYAVAMRCPLWCWAMSKTDLSYAATPCPVRYAARPYPVLADAMLLRGVRY
eukprot:15784-Rhodomonas_salina.2